MNNVDDGTEKKEIRIKLIRAESLGSFRRDYKQNGVGSSISDNGSNDWTDSQLMMMLNPEDVVKAGWKATGKNYTIDNEGYVIDNKNQKIYRGIGSYFNRTSGFKPAQASTTNFTEETIDFNENGLTTESKKLIDKAVYHLGGIPSNELSTVTASMYYSKERSNLVYNNRPTTWTGYIGLMYPSDYGFATSKSECLTKTLYYYDDNNKECHENDWLLISSSLQFTILPFSSSSSQLVGMNNKGHVGLVTAYDENSAIPVVYLKSDVKITSGDGSKDNPFILTI